MWLSHQSWQVSLLFYSDLIASELRDCLWASWWIFDVGRNIFLPAAPHQEKESCCSIVSPAEQKHLLRYSAHQRDLWWGGDGFEEKWTNKINVYVKTQRFLYHQAAGGASRPEMELVNSEQELRFFSLMGCCISSSTTQTRLPSIFFCLLLSVDSAQAKPKRTNKKKNQFSFALTGTCKLLHQMLCCTFE